MRIGLVLLVLSMVGTTAWSGISGGEHIENRVKPLSFGATCLYWGEASHCWKQARKFLRRATCEHEPAERANRCERKLEKVDAETRELNRIRASVLLSRIVQSSTPDIETQQKAADLLTNLYPAVDLDLETATDHEVLNQAYDDINQGNYVRAERFLLHLTPKSVHIRIVLPETETEIDELDGLVGRVPADTVRVNTRIERNIGVVEEDARIALAYMYYLSRDFWAAIAVAKDSCESGMGNLHACYYWYKFRQVALERNGAEYSNRAHGRPFIEPNRDPILDRLEKPWKRESIAAAACRDGMHAACYDLAMWGMPRDVVLAVEGPENPFGREQHPDVATATHYIAWETGHVAVKVAKGFIWVPRRIGRWVTGTQKAHATKKKTLQEERVALLSKVCVHQPVTADEVAIVESSCKYLNHLTGGHETK